MPNRTFVALDSSNVRYPTYFDGADLGVKIAASFSDLPSTGGVIDARAFEGDNTIANTITLGSASKPCVLLLPAGRLITSAATLFSIPAGAVVWIEGHAMGSTSLIYTGSGASAITWSGSRGGASNLTISGGASSGHGLVLSATVSNSILHNTFSNIRMGGPSGATYNGIQLLANSATGLVSFNTFDNFEINDYANDIYLDTNGASQGPTNNRFLGVKVAKTTSIYGAGVKVVKGDVNTFTDIYAEGNVNGVLLTGGNKNRFICLDLEGNTNDLVLSSASCTENMFLGVFSANDSISDSGTRTVILQSSSNITNRLPGMSTAGAMSVGGTLSAFGQTAMGAGATPLTGVQVYVNPTSLTGTDQASLQAVTSSTSQATAQATGMLLRAETAAGTTQSRQVGLDIQTGVIGSGATVAEANGLRVEACPTDASAKYAIRTLGSADTVLLAGPLVASSTLQTGATGSLISLIKVYSPVLSPAQVAANTSAEQTFSVSGLATTDKVFLNKPSAQAGLGIVGCRVSATDTLAITFANFTASPITPTASETYQVLAIRS